MIVVTCISLVNWRSKAPFHPPLMGLQSINDFVTFVLISSIMKALERYPNYKHPNQPIFPNHEEQFKCD